MWDRLNILSPDEVVDSLKEYPKSVKKDSGYELVEARKGEYEIYQADRDDPVFETEYFDNAMDYFEFLVGRSELIENENENNN